MRYLGGKKRLGNYLSPIVKSYLKHDSIYIEPFVGGLGMFSYMVDIPNLIIANDIDTELIAFWQMIQLGYIPPKDITKEQYYEYKDNTDKPYERAFVKYFCSFGGKEWGGYARNAKNYNYAKQASASALKEKYAKNIVWYSLPFQKLPILESSHCVYYLDPPYKNTTKYKKKFDFNKFDEWVKKLKNIGHTVIISEYSLPYGEIVWQKEKKVTFHSKKSKNVVEKLYKIQY